MTLLINGKPGLVSGAMGSATAVVSNPNLIDIDPAWLAANGPAPYYLRTAGKTYVLRTDVTVEGTAFIILNANITFDLNGHTITYGENTPPTVTNAGFETDSIGATTITGWTKSGPGTTTIAAVRAGMHGTKMLHITGISSATAVTSSNITIPLSGVEYAAHIICKAEESPGVTVKLEVVDTVTSSILGTSSSVPSVTARGTGPVVKWKATTTNAVKLVITSTPVGGSPYVDLDYASLRRSRDFGVIGSHGIYNNASAINFPLHLQTATTNANVSKVNNFTLKGPGTVAMGTGNVYGGSPVNCRETTGVTIQNASLTFGGMDNNTIELSEATNVSITGNTITGTAAADHISTRFLAFSAVKGANVYGTVVVTGNTITGNGHVGISVSRHSSYLGSDPPNISNNTITLNTLGTDGYGIVIVNLKNFSIAGNTIQPVNGRGILLDTWSTNGKTSNGTISGNIVESREVENLEYDHNGLQATAFRMRSFLPYTNVDSFRDLNISGNTFFAETGTGADRDCVAARITFHTEPSNSPNQNVVFDNNTFKARLNSIDPSYTNPRAVALSITAHSVHDQTIFSNNNLLSNETSLALGDTDGYGEVMENITFISNTCTKLAEGAALTYSTILIGDWAGVPKNNYLFGNKYAGGATPTFNWLGAAVKNIQIGWLLDVTVMRAGSPVVGATVTALDKDSVLKFTGTTDAAGHVIVPLISTIYSQLGSNPATITPVNRYPFTVSATDGTHSANDTITTLTADVAHTVTLP